MMSYIWFVISKKDSLDSSNSCSNTSGETSLMMNALKALWQL